MKLKPFKEMIALSKEKLDEAMAPIRARSVEIEANLKMNQLEADILTKQQKVQELCIEKKVDFDKIMDLLDEIALLERRQKQYKEVLTDLFPTE